MILVYAYNLACISLLAGLAEYSAPTYSMPISLAAYSLLAGQVVNSLLLMGFSGRSMMAGILVGSLMTALAYMVVGFAQHGTLQIHSLMYAPVNLISLGWLLLMTRFLWGWQVISHPNETIPYRRWRIEDYLLLTVGVATIWILFVRSMPLYDRPMMSLWLSSQIGFSCLAQFLCLILIGLARLYLRHRLDHLAMFLVLCGIYGLPFLLVIWSSGSEVHLEAVSGTFLCAVCTLGSFFVYRVAGLRLVCYADRTEIDEELLTDAEREYVRRSRTSARIATALFFIIAIVAMATSEMASQAEQPAAVIPIQ